MNGLQQVHVRVTDAATGQPTPVRMRVTDSQANYYAPLGRLTEFATGSNQDVGGNLVLGGKAWAYIDGGCEIQLPPGPLRVQVVKGPQYQPIDAEVPLAAGKLSLRFEIQRWADFSKAGWHSGDTRVHYLPPHAALLEAQAEDVAVVHLLARQTLVKDSFGKRQPAIPNLLAFSGQTPCLQVPNHFVVVNTENYHPELGSLGLLHCHRVVHPLTFGGPDGQEDWTLEDWCGQCHRKHGLVVWTRTLHEGAEFSHGAPLAALLLGEVDAFEMDHYEDSPFDALSLWYDLLGLGLRVPLAGASGKDSNGVALGTIRTYVQVPQGEPLTLPSWIDGLRAGRTFISNGPLLTMSVDDQGPGAQIQATTGQVRVRAGARSLIPFDVLEIVRNGKVVAQTPPSGSPAEATLDMDVPVSESCWLAARCRGAATIYHRPANQRVFAHTSPVYCEVPDQPVQPRASVIQRFAKEMDQLIAWGEAKARYPTPQDRERFLQGLFKARDRLAQIVHNS